MQYYIGEYKYSILKYLDNSSTKFRVNNSFELIQHWPTQDVFKHWRQLNSPTSVVEKPYKESTADNNVTGFAMINDTYPVSWWGGLMLQYNRTKYSYLDGQVNDWHWHACVGSYLTQYAPLMPCVKKYCNETALYCRVNWITYESTISDDYNYESNNILLWFPVMIVFKYDD